MRLKHLLSLLILSLLLIGCGGKAESDLTRVNLPMGYVANVQFSPFYLAAERGYFTEAGFDVNFDYRWETDGISLLAADTIPFAIASGDQVIQARSQGLPVVAVAAWYQRFPVAIVSLETLPLDSPTDLAGLRIGIPETFGASYIGLRALLTEAGLTEADIDLRVIGYTQLAALTSGSVDAVVVYTNNAPAILEQEGIAYNILYVADYANMVSAVLVTSDMQIERDPEQVRAFVGAFLHGLADVLADPDAAFEISHRYIEGLAENAAAQRAVLEASIALWEAPEPGRLNADLWAEAQQVMFEAGLIQQTVPVETLFTNDFLP